MAKEKTTQSGIDRLIDRLSHMKARLEKVEQLHRTSNSAEWGPLKALLKEQIEMHGNSVKALAESEHLDDTERCRRIDKSRAQRDTFQFVVDLVETPESQSDILRKNITDLEQELAEKRADLKEFGGVES